MNISAIYKRTIKGVGQYDTMVDGKLYATGALPERINGKRVIWRNSTARSADYSGTLQ